MVKYPVGNNILIYPDWLYETSFVSEPILAYDVDLIQTRNQIVTTQGLWINDNYINHQQPKSVKDLGSDLLYPDLVFLDRYYWWSWYSELKRGIEIYYDSTTGQVINQLEFSPNRDLNIKKWQVWRLFNETDYLLGGYDELSGNWYWWRKNNTGDNYRLFQTWSNYNSRREPSLSRNGNFLAYWPTETELVITRPDTNPGEELIVTRYNWPSNNDGCLLWNIDYSLYLNLTLNTNKHEWWQLDLDGNSNLIATDNLKFHSYSYLDKNTWLIYRSGSYHYSLLQNDNFQPWQIPINTFCLTPEEVSLGVNNSVLGLNYQLNQPDLPNDDQTITLTTPDGTNLCPPSRSRVRVVITMSQPEAVWQYYNGELQGSVMDLNQLATGIWIETPGQYQWLTNQTGVWLQAEITNELTNPPEVNLISFPDVFLCNHTQGNVITVTDYPPEYWPDSIFYIYRNGQLIYTQKRPDVLVTRIGVYEIKIVNNQQCWGDVITPPLIIRNQENFWSRFSLVADRTFYLPQEVVQTTLTIQRQKLPPNWSGRVNWYYNTIAANTYLGTGLTWTANLAGQYWARIIDTTNSCIISTDFNITIIKLPALNLSLQPNPYYLLLDSSEPNWQLSGQVWVNYSEPSYQLNYLGDSTLTSPDPPGLYQAQININHYSGSWSWYSEPAELIRVNLYWYATHDIEIFNPDSILELDPGQYYWLVPNTETLIAQEIRINNQIRTQTLGLANEDLNWQVTWQDTNTGLTGVSQGQIRVKPDIIPRWQINGDNINWIVPPLGTRNLRQETKFTWGEDNKYQWHIDYRLDWQKPEIQVIGQWTINPNQALIWCYRLIVDYDWRIKNHIWLTPEGELSSNFKYQGCLNRSWAGNNLDVKVELNFEQTIILPITVPEIPDLIPIIDILIAPQENNIYQLQLQRNYNWRDDYKDINWLSDWQPRLATTEDGWRPEVIGPGRSQRWYQDNQGRARLYQLDYEVN